MLFRTVPREHWLIQQEHALGTTRFTIKKLGPAFCRSTLRSVLTQNDIVFTHGFTETTLSTAHFILTSVRKYFEITGVNVSIID